MIVDGSQGTGVSAIWLLANICYAGMRAQGHPSRWWRVVSFLFGLPGTLLSWLVVNEEAIARMASICRLGEIHESP